MLLLAVYGCAQAIRGAMLRLLAPPQKSNGVWLVPLSGHCEDVEYLVRSASAHRRWSSGSEICLLDVGADNETRAIADRLCSEMDGVRLLCAEELPDFLTQCQNCQK